MHSNSQSGSRQRRLVIFVVGLLVIAGIAASGAILLTRGQQSAAQEPAVTYILDISPRMDLSAQKGTRLDVAQAILAEVVRPSDPELTAGLRVFGSGAIDQACEDTELVIPLALANQPAIADELLELSVGSSTESALAQSVVAAIRDLNAVAGPHYIVVVTGGADSCNPQAGELVASEAERAGIDLQLFLIGFKVSEDHAQALKTAAETIGSTIFFNAPDAAALRTALLDIGGRIERGALLAIAAVESSAAAQPTRPAQPPTPSQTPLEPTRTLAPISPTETISPYSEQELAALGRHRYLPPESNEDHPCWVVRFQSSPVLQFDFQGPDQLVFDASYTFFVSDTRVPVIMLMNRSEQNVWNGSYSTVIDVYNFSVSEDIVFEEDGIIWHEIFQDSRPGYYSNTVECGPAKWTRVP